jgi:thiol-disulfide isomerase/thioredoxin
MKHIFVSLTLLLLIGGGCTNAVSKAPSKASDERAPVFTLNDLDSTLVESTDFIGNPHVINAWATWCPFCRKELADFAELQEEFPGVPIIAINRGESIGQVKSYVKERGIEGQLVYLLDPSDSFYRSVGGFAMPETLFVQADGSVMLHKRGVMSKSDIREQIELLLSS